MYGYLIDMYYLPIIFGYQSMRLTRFIFSIVFKHVRVSISFKIINVPTLKVILVYL